MLRQQPKFNPKGENNMKTYENYASDTNIPLPSPISKMTPNDIAEKFENIMLKMIYRISQEDMHVPDNVGTAA